MNAITLDKDKVSDAIRHAHDTNFPLLICMVATKACYIKFSGLIRALEQGNYPFIALESGQHYEPLLTMGADELGYREHLSGIMHLEGDLAGKSASLFDRLDVLNTRLRVMGVGPSMLAVCGDTMTAGVAPFAWYMITGQRSVHTEAGLRSMAPRWPWIANDFLRQRYVPWEVRPTRPFPEGLCTRIASIASQQLFAPVDRNEENLVKEGYEHETIYVSGSPSVDAVQYAKECIKLNERITSGSRIRVDIHRRENLCRERLLAIFDGVSRLATSGLPIEFVITKSMQICKDASWQEKDMNAMKDNGVEITLQTASYISVIRFLLSRPMAILTDSGGFQEETAILGVPCITCRYETDRPETVLDFKTNVLVPPVSGEFICKSVTECLNNPKEAWPGLGLNETCYGNDVGTKTVQRLKEITPELASSVVLK